MTNVLVIAADARLARFYDVERVESPRVKGRLVERASIANPDLKTLGTSTPGRPRTETNTNREGGPVHPIGAQRERHRLDIERRFGKKIASEAGAITKGWKSGTVVLIAEPGLLGLVREPLRAELNRDLTLKELAKDYMDLPEAELWEHLTAALPAPSAGPSSR